ncbi:MAG: hypothetical protein QW670_05285 [Candidatus Bathyarchaeia archaeon]
MFKGIRSYLPFLTLCLISLALGFYSLNLYVDAYLVLNRLKLGVESVQVNNETLTINVIFIISNPSNIELKLVYFKPSIYLKGVEIMLESPSFIKYPTGSELLIPPLGNVSIIFSKKLDPAFSQTFWQLYENSGNEWFFSVYFSLKNVPLMDISTLQRYARFAG